MYSTLVTLHIVNILLCYWTYVELLKSERRYYVHKIRISEYFIKGSYVHILKYTNKNHFSRSLEKLFSGNKKMLNIFGEFLRLQYIQFAIC